MKSDKNYGHKKIWDVFLKKISNLFVANSNEQKLTKFSKI